MKLLPQNLSKFQVMVKGYFLESRNSKKRQHQKKTMSRFGIQRIYGFIQKQVGKILRGTPLYRSGLSKKSAGIRLQIKNFLLYSLMAVNQRHYFTIPLHMHLILSAMVRLTISCTIWLMVPKSYF